MGRSRDIADMLSNTEILNTANERLLNKGENVGIDSAYVDGVVGQPLSFLSTLDSLPITSLEVGQQAYVSSNNRLYISDGSGWYQKAFITLSPTMTLDPTGTITLATDGTTASTVTIIPADSDTPSSQLSFSVESDGSMLGRAILSQDSSVFTIRPLSADSGATDGTFTLTFKTTDADTNFATASTDFSLTFSTAVDSSAPTVLLMKAAGNSATNAAITYQNSSDVSTGFTETGDPQAGTFSPYRSGGYSAYFDGTTDWIEIPDGDWKTWSNNFTIEGWFYIPSFSTGNKWICGDFASSGITSTSSVNIGINHSQKQLINYTNISGSTQTLNSASNSIEAGKWHHFAVVRESTSNYTLYLDGVSVDTATNAGTITNSTQVYSIGRLGAYDGAYFNGYVSDLRAVNGTAVYTSAFTPPTERLTAVTNTSLLACHLPYFVDGSTYDHTITVNGDTKTLPFGPYDYEPWTADDHGGSLYTPANNAYVSSTGVPQVGSTGVAGHLELWWYPVSTTAGSGYSYLFLGNDMSSGNYIEWNSNVTRFQIQTGGGVTTQMLWTNANMLHVNSWNHIWIQKNASNYWDVWINGKNLGTVSSSYGQTHTGAITPQVIGAGFSSTYGGVQYIADMKIGTDIKSNTDDFTPPTEPLTHDANTTFLMNNKSDANVYDAAAGNVFKLNGNTTSTTSQRKFTTSSAVTFDGTGDTAVVKSSDIFGYGTGDFTWEAWIYVPGAKSNHYLLDHGSNGGIMNIANNKIRYYNSTVGVGSALYTTGATISYATWHHVAFVRSSGTTTIYVDGTAGASASDTHNYTALALTIGDYGGGSYGYAGTLQDLRITKGYARYTAAFTPPTAEFEL